MVQSRPSTLEMQDLDDLVVARLEQSEIARVVSSRRRTEVQNIHLLPQFDQLGSIQRSGHARSIIDPQVGADIGSKDAIRKHDRPGRSKLHRPRTGVPLDSHSKALTHDHRGIDDRILGQTIGIDPGGGARATRRGEDRNTSARMIVEIRRRLSAMCEN